MPSWHSVFMSPAIHHVLNCLPNLCRRWVVKWTERRLGHVQLEAAPAGSCDDWEGRFLPDSALQIMDCSQAKACCAGEDLSGVYAAYPEVGNASRSVGDGEHVIAVQVR